MLELAAVLTRLGLCSVLLCWMHFMALGLERLQSPPFDLYATIKQYLSSPSSLVAILGHYLGNCSRPAASRWIERVFQVECKARNAHVAVKFQV